MSVSVRVPAAVLVYVRHVAKMHGLTLSEAATMLIMREQRGPK